MLRSIIKIGKKIPQKGEEVKLKISIITPPPFLPCDTSFQGLGKKKTNLRSLSKMVGTKRPEVLLRKMKKV